MNITHTRVITFSPTHTSLQVATAVARAWQDLPGDTLDLTCRQLKSPIRLANDCLAIVSVPVYAGRVAPLALKRLKTVLGDATPAILIATYGNRDYEDALVELRDVLTAQGFLPLAAGAFIGEHSYSRPGMPIAEGRPDAQDLREAETFGRQAFASLTRQLNIAETPDPAARDFALTYDAPLEQLVATPPMKGNPEKATRQAVWTLPAASVLSTWLPVRWLCWALAGLTPRPWSARACSSAR